MNNSAWQKHRVCAMETSLERKVGALLMRLRDVRRGSSPLNLGHGEPSKVFELWSYTKGKERGDALTSSQKGVPAGPPCSPPPSAPFLRSASLLPPNTQVIHFPLGRVQTQAAPLPSLLWITWAAPLC